MAWAVEPLAVRLCFPMQGGDVPTPSVPHPVSDASRTDTAAIIRRRGAPVDELTYVGIVVHSVVGVMVIRELKLWIASPIPVISAST